MSKLRNRQITKDDVRFIVQNWDKMNVLDISEKLGLNPHQVRRIARELRRNGFDLPSKKGIQKKGSLKQFIEELKEKN